MTVEQRDGDPIAKPWAIYIRVSTKHQADDGYSLLEQEEILTAYAEERGSPILGLAVRRQTARIER